MIYIHPSHMPHLPPWVDLLKYIYNICFIYGSIYSVGTISAHRCTEVAAFKWLKKYEEKILWLWKFQQMWRIAVRVQKCNKIAKKLMGTFSKYFLKISDIRRYSPIFKKYFENVPIIFFAILLHFWTRTAILHICWSFHNPRIFSSYFFSHLKAATFVHLCAQIVPTE